MWRWEQKTITRLRINVKSGQWRVVTTEWRQRSFTTTEHPTVVIWSQILQLNQLQSVPVFRNIICFHVFIREEENKERMSKVKQTFVPAHEIIAAERPQISTYSWVVFLFVLSGFIWACVLYVIFTTTIFLFDLFVTWESDDCLATC